LLVKEATKEKSAPVSPLKKAATPKNTDSEEAELRKKQKEIEKELKIKQLHGETLDELSLLAE
jgi:hypothetical protein